MRIKNPSVLHVIQPDKFIAPFIDFLEEHFQDFDRHLFACEGDPEKYPIRRRSNVFFNKDFARKPWFYLHLNRECYRADKIIIHGLWSGWVIRILALQPWLLRKCYWVIWGGDLYSYKMAPRDRSWMRLERFRRLVIRRLGHLVTFLEGDVNLAREWYGARGEYHDCLMYPSNLYKDIEVPPKTSKTINIQIGNSADPGNEHFEMMALLEPFKDRDIRIYAPLSYGPSDHADKVEREGRKRFGEKFVPMRQFQPYPDYLAYLAQIDIAIFNHRRQQAMGNIISLLGMGKKVYLRRDVTSWEVFEKQGVEVFDGNAFNLEQIDGDIADGNVRALQQNFSKQVLKEQWEKIFE